MDFDADMTLSARLKIFKSTNFDPHSYVTDQCGASTEKVNLKNHPFSLMIVFVFNRWKMVGV